MVLNRPDAETPADPFPHSDLLDIEIGPLLTTVEDQNLNLKTKRDKAAGINSILAEMLKAKISTTTAVFSNLFSSMWSD